MNRAEALQRLERSAIGHLATVRANGAPHLVPITFALDSDRIVHMVDQKPKTTTRLQRLTNIRANPEVSLLVDHYDSDWARLWWARIDGTAHVLDDGSEWAAARSALVSKYPQYRDSPPSGPAVLITIVEVSGWAASG
jgi:PPOX class probable F420-dependent enzyme